MSRNDSDRSSGGSPNPREASLRQREVRLRAIFNHAPVGLWEVGLDGGIRMVNQMLCSILGRSRVELLRTDIGDVIFPEDRAASVAAISQLVKHRTPVSIDKRYVRPDGLLVWAHCILTLLENEDGSPQAILAATIDVTDRLGAEERLRRARDELEERVASRSRELEQREAQLSRLTSELTVAEERERYRIAQVLHDHLQQLLVAATFRLSLLERKIPAEAVSSLHEVKRLVDEANRESRSLTAELSPPVLHEGGLQAGLRWLSRWLHEKHGFELAVKIMSAPAVEGEAIRILLFRSVRELLLNTIKHSGVKVAEVTMAMVDPNQLEVTVVDQGKGFCLEDLEGPVTGVSRGFGLFSIRERIRHLGGTFEIESSPGKGAVFRLTVAVAEDDPIPEPSIDPLPPAEQPAALAAAVKDRDNCIRILLAEDHLTVRTGLHVLIDSEPDLQVVGVASDGEEAVAQARELRPDVLVLDYSMPKLDGAEAARRVHAELPQIRIICLSMYEVDEVSATMFGAGASAYLTKSVSPDRLINAIRGTASAPCES